MGESSSYFGIGEMPSTKKADVDSSTLGHLLGAWEVDHEEVVFADGDVAYEPVVMSIDGAAALSIGEGRVLVNEVGFVWDGEVDNKSRFAASFPANHIVEIDKSIDEESASVFISVKAPDNSKPVGIMISMDGAGSQMKVVELCEKLEFLQASHSFLEDAEEGEERLRHAEAGSTSPGLKKNEKGKNRRTSICFEDIMEVIGDDDEGNQSENAQEERAIANEGDHDTQSNEIRNIVRKIVRNHNNTNDMESELLHLSENYAYELSCVPTPSKARIDVSPPRLKKPEKEQYNSLRPILKEMQAANTSEQTEIETATRVRILRGAGKKPYSYLDQDTNQVLPPQEYSRRYLLYLSENSAGGREIGRKDDESTSSMQTRLQSTRSSVPLASPERKPVSVERRSSPYVNADHTSFEMSQTMGQEIAAAEEELHLEFDRAMSHFLTKKKQILSKYGVQSPRSAEKAHAGSQPEEKKKTKKKKSTTPKTSPKKTSSRKPKRQTRIDRRKSLSFDHVLQILEGNDENN